MFRSKIRRALLLLFLLCCTAFLLWPQERLKFSFQNTICYLADTQFILQWRHSVELQNWQEHYRLSSGNLLLDASYIQTFGAGTPSTGEVIEAPDGYIGFNSKVVLPNLHWIVSRHMQGKVITNKGVWQIYQMVPDYTEIKIEPLKRNRIFFWLGNNCYDNGYLSSDYK